MNAPTPTSSAPTSPPTSPIPPPVPAARVRVSDAERERVVERLHRAVGEGRLDLAEVDARSAAAYAARYRDELAPLLADLPDPGPAHPSAAPGWTELWVSLVWRVRTLLLLGADRPTARQGRTAALLTLLAVLWTVVWAFAGAGAVG